MASPPDPPDTPSLLKHKQAVILAYIGESFQAKAPGFVIRMQCTSRLLHP
jgi:hypothetical protein